ncbi:MAG: hypothetical protein CMP06_13235 [Xanthomonadales bacterium]|nr:hypothetical protein [Xanthomonadales bacterium]
MKVSKLLLIGTVAAGALALHGCTEGDETSITLTSNTTDDGGNDGSGGTSQNCPAAFSTARPQTADGMDVCELNAFIQADATLTNDIIWRLDGRVTVGNGDQELASATQLASGDALLNVDLTIEAGTQIVGADALVPTAFSNLVITRGSRILANGTAAEPIVFSSEDDDLDGSQEWGGLIISGFAPHANCTGAVCNVDGEGNAGFIGGDDPTDDSGVLRYVILAEGGEIINNDGDEINGISFNSVGSATTVEYIQVQGNADDGVEFYGGTVNAKYVVLTANQDDSLDWDEGFSGNIQYLLVVQADGTGDFCIEADTLGDSTNPYSIPTIANATFVCSGDPETVAFRMKESTGGFFHHTVVATGGSPEGCFGIEDMGAQQNATGDPIRLGINQFICDATTFEYDEVNDTRQPSNFLQQAPVSTDDPQLDALYAAQSAAANGVTPTDFATFNTNFPESTAIPAFLDQTDYIGAVDPDATEAWWAGWTLDGTL